MMQPLAMKTFRFHAFEGPGGEGKFVDQGNSQASPALGTELRAAICPQTRRALFVVRDACGILGVLMDEEDRLDSEGLKERIPEAYREPICVQAINAKGETAISRAWAVSLPGLKKLAGTCKSLTAQSFNTGIVWSLEPQAG